MNKVTFLNHSSVLLQRGDNFILTDPWYDKPAFGSWLSVPPPIYHPAYFIAMAKSNPKFAIVISHGHDDHLDDNFLSIMPKETTVLIPKYKSAGLIRRIQKCGLTNIKQFDSKGLTHNGAVFKSYIFEDISMDDAFITIDYKEDFIVAHANDNWQELPTSVKKQVKSDFLKHKRENTLFMSQTNLADGFPLIYDNYTQEEKKVLVKKRQDKMILTSVNNAISVGAGAFLSYAGLASPFIKNQDNFINDSYSKSLLYIKDLLLKNNLDSSLVLDMMPGDSYNFKNVVKLFNNQFYSHEQLKEASVEFYNKYGVVSKCDTFQDHQEKMDIKNKRSKLDLFLYEFKKFLMAKSRQTNYKEDVHSINFTFKDSEISQQCKLSDDSKCDVVFVYDNIILEEILRGKINWENSYIGYESRVLTDNQYNIGSLIRWLSMFGYVYQNRVIKNNEVLR